MASASCCATYWSRGRSFASVLNRAFASTKLPAKIDFSFVRERLKDSYSDTGRPSIDPELLLRIVLIGYLYGISSERKLIDELRMHLPWRWFTGLGFDQETVHETFQCVETCRCKDHQ